MTYNEILDKFQTGLEELATEASDARALVVVARDTVGGAGKISDWECMHTSLSADELTNLLTCAIGTIIEGERKAGKNWDQPTIRSFFDKLATRTARFLTEEDVTIPPLS